MKDNVKRAFYVHYVAHACFLDIIAQRPEIRLDRLANDTPDAIAQPIIAAAHAYQIGSARDELEPRFHASRNLLDRMPNLLIVSTNGAGFDTVNIEACTDAGILVMNQSGGNAEAVAVHVLAMLLALAKQIAQTDHALRQGKVRDRAAFTGNDVTGRTIGIVGLGNVGSAVAKVCRGLLGMQVIACDPYLDAQTMAERGAAKVKLDELLRRSDFVSINCPLDEGTRGMMGAAQFGLMQPHAYFINTARGFIHDEAALLDALTSKKIAGAGIDVWEKEPPPPEHPLLQLDNVIASPHTAGLTRETRANMGKIAAEQLIMALDGKRPPRIVNPQVWPLYTKRFEQTFGFCPQG
jgi:D-3-phosphoglycerate dehydrogenase / 2-oxoglutarate reductase